MDDTCHEIDRCIIDFVAKVEAITTKKQKAFASMKDVRTYFSVLLLI